MGWGNILDGLQDIETTETNMRFKPDFVLFFFMSLHFIFISY